jgi:signal transduction histidine kinase
VVADLTEQNLLIQEREQSRVDIETLTAERDLRERFVNTLSHDLRNPLSAVKTSAQMIARTACENSRHPDLAQRIVNAVTRADQMLTDLLDASRIKAGQSLPMEISRWDMGELVEEVCEELATIHGSRFVRHIEGPAIGYWDRDLLRRAIENLAINAVKYGSRNTQITFTVKQSSERVQVSVGNLGNPIEPEDLSTLFDPFYRAKSAKASKQEGWGIGLTLVRGVSEAHGGTVRVQSSPVSGTIFTISLPRDAQSSSLR